MSGMSEGSFQDWRRPAINLITAVLTVLRDSI
jgi:hypothetical protein